MDEAVCDACGVVEPLNTIGKGDDIEELCALCTCERSIQLARVNLFAAGHQLSPAQIGGLEALRRAFERAMESGARVSALHYGECLLSTLAIMKLTEGPHA